MPSTNFLQWNSSETNQETDAEYLADSQRLGGAPVGAVFPSPLANKIFYQLSTFCTAFANFMVANGQSASDASLSALQAAFAALLAPPTTVLKTGNGSSPYTTSSTSYVVVDGTSLAYTVTIPLGWKLVILTTGVMYVTVSSNTAGFIGLYDTESASILTQEEIYLPELETGGVPWSLNWVVAGDGNSHTIELQYKATNGSDAVYIDNVGTRTPTMVFILTPSN